MDGPLGQKCNSCCSVSFVPLACSCTPPQRAYRQEQSGRILNNLMTTGSSLEYMEFMIGLLPSAALINVMKFLKGTDTAQEVLQASPILARLHMDRTDLTHFVSDSYSLVTAFTLNH